MSYAIQLPVDFNAAGDTIVIAGVAGKRIRIQGLDLTLAAVSTMQFKHGATAFTGAMSLDAYSKPLSEAPYFACADGEAFKITLGAAVQCSGSIWYRQD